MKVIFKYLENRVLMFMKILIKLILCLLKSKTIASNNDSKNKYDLAYFNGASTYNKEVVI